MGPSSQGAGSRVDATSGARRRRLRRYGPASKHVASVPPMQTHSTGPPSGPTTITTRLTQSGPGVCRAITGIARTTPNTRRTARIHPKGFTLHPGPRTWDSTPSPSCV